MNISNLIVVFQYHSTGESFFMALFDWLDFFFHRLSFFCSCFLWNWFWQSNTLLVKGFTGKHGNLKHGPLFKRAVHYRGIARTKNNIRTSRVIIIALGYGIAARSCCLATLQKGFQDCAIFPQNPVTFLLSLKYASDYNKTVISTF